MRTKTLRKDIKTMKNKAFKTKLLTVLLTLCMLLSLVPISAFAVDSTVSNETELTAALEMRTARRSN